MFSRTAGETSKTVEVTPFFVLSFFSKVAI
jgi:hypothetical protein